MPEGDTLFKIREAIRPDLVGATLRRVELWGRRARSLERTVERLITTGKHLFVVLDSGEMIRTHLGMHGTWHRYRPESRWRLPRREAGCALWTDRLVLVCFRAKEIECLGARQVRSHRTLGRLGPDVLAPEFADAVDDHLDTVLERAAHFGDLEAPVVDLLLDQRIAAGIGNVYKSEALFLDGVHPNCPLGAVDESLRRKLFITARGLMMANLGGWGRTTTVDRREEREPRQRLWVYGRGGEACSRCGDAIQTERFGFGRRVTFWCERCQPLDGARRSEPASSRPSAASESNPPST